MNWIRKQRKLLRQLEGMRRYIKNLKEKKQTFKKDDRANLQVLA